MTVEEQITAVERTAVALADAMRAEATLRLERAEHEAALTASLLGNPNPETGKPHSITSAQLWAAQDETTLRLRREITDAEAEVIVRRGQHRAADLRAQLAVALAPLAGSL